MKLDPFMTYLQERVASAKPDWIPATVLIREIREQGYTGGISQLKVFLDQRTYTVRSCLERGFLRTTSFG
jgi:transposase